MRRHSSVNCKRIHQMQLDVWLRRVILEVDAAVIAQRVTMRTDAPMSGESTAFADVRSSRNRIALLHAICVNARSFVEHATPACLRDHLATYFSTGRLHCHLNSMGTLLQ